MTTKIEWAEETWNPIVGCSRVSDGCRNCYAERVAHRFRHLPKYTAVTKPEGGWNNQMFFDEKALLMPLSWKKPRRIFVNSMGDLFHENVPFAEIDKVFAIMALCPQHHFIILTKRPKRMRVYMANADVAAGAARWAAHYWGGEDPDAAYEQVFADMQKPLPNVWLGVSVEDQSSAVDRIPYLLDTPAAVRFISAEPLLGEVDLTDLRTFEYDKPGDINCFNGRCYWPSAKGFEDSINSIARYTGKLDWVIVGGESGQGARPMHPDWARKIRDDCEAANVPFFFKQWGLRFPSGQMMADGRVWNVLNENAFCNLAPKMGGNFLDGKKHLEYPKIGGS